MRTRHQQPIKRVNKSGTVWIARFTGPDGKRRWAKPDWNDGRSTFKRKAAAQRAIDEAWDELTNRRHAPEEITLGVYAKTWTTRHPRSERTNKTNDHRVGRILAVEIAGVELRDWPLDDLRRKHGLELVDHLFRVQGRSPRGVTNILRSLSALMEDAITDEAAEVNAFQGIKVRANDPRATKAKRPVRVLTFEQMHRFATFAGSEEPLVRSLSDCGLRLGEALPLERTDYDGETFDVTKTAHEGTVSQGTKRDKLRDLEEPEGRRAPVPPSTAAVIAAAPTRIDTPLMFPTKTGKLWRERNFYRDCWYPTQERHGEAVLVERGVKVPAPVPEGLNIRDNAAAVRKRRAAIRELLAAHDLDWRPHEFRHSWVSNLQAEGVDQADLAEMAGHTLETMIGTYTHALDRSADRVRGIIG